MCRYSYIRVVHLIWILLCLLLAGCGGPASKIDEILNSLTERDAFTGSVLVAQRGEVLLS